ncbi:MAG: hypothetical protein ACXAD7_11600 [Candidatus Kariarchaeaceae archaeon]
MPDPIDKTINESIEALIKKAEKIVALEEAENKKIESLTQAREEDGRLAIRIKIFNDEKNLVEHHINRIEIYQYEYQEIFDLLQTYSGDTLREKIHDHPDMTWDYYTKVYHNYLQILDGKTIIELQDRLNNYQGQVNELQIKRMEHQKIDEMLDKSI